MGVFNAINGFISSSIKSDYIYSDYSKNEEQENIEKEIKEVQDEIDKTKKILKQKSNENINKISP